MNEEQKPQAWEEAVTLIHNAILDYFDEKESYLSTDMAKELSLVFIKVIDNQRQKDKERLMEGIEKLWNKNTPLTKRTLPDGRIEYKQSGPFNVTEASLEDFKNLLNQIYE